MSNQPTLEEQLKKRQEKKAVTSSKLAKIKNTVILLVLLYIAVTIPIMYKNWDNIFYAVTHQEDMNWIKSLKDDAWKEKKAKMLEEKQAQQEGKEVSLAKKKELPANLKQLIEGTPMEEMESAMINNKYGVSPYLIVGIAKAESNLGTDFYHWKDYKNNNFWGIKPQGGIREDGSYLAWYNTPEDGVNEMARLIKENYIDKGYDTIDKIVVRYVGRDSATWKGTVNSVMTMSENKALLALK